MENEISSLKAQVAELQKELNKYDYDYKAAVKADAISYIEEMYDYGTIDIEDLATDNGREKICGICWYSDRVTGKASGSYTCSTYEAECYICHNMNIYIEAFSELDAEPNNEYDPESIDVAIRCYILGQVLGQAINTVFEEHKDELDKDENEDD